MGRTLSLEVLEYLGRRSDSPFTRAFLIAFVHDNPPADAGPTHWLRTCVDAFVTADLGGVVELRDLGRHLSTQTLLTELRKSEDARAFSVALGTGTSAGLDVLRTQVMQDDTLALGAVRTAIGTLPRPATCDAQGSCAGLRAALTEVEAQLAALIQARERARLEALHRTLRSDLDEELRALRQAVGADTALRALVSPDTLEAADCRDSRLPEAPPAVQRACARVLDLEGQREAVGNRLADVPAGGDVAGLERKRDEALQALDRAVEQVERLARKEPLDLEAPAAAVGAPRLAAPAPPSASLASEPVRAPPADLLVGLTDFVVDRAKQEAVLSFLQTIHGWMRSRDDGAVLAGLFPTTNAMMTAVEEPDGDGAVRLRIRSAAQVPLPTWRATLRSDFEAIPRSLTDRMVGVLCTAQAACEARAAQARVAFAIGTRLVDGEPVLRVLADEATGALTDAGGEDAAWARVRVGLYVVGQLVEAYRVQGRTAGGEASDLLLSAQTLRAGSGSVDEALYRVLVAQAAARSPGDLAARLAIDEGAFVAATQRVVERIETLAALLQPAGSEGRPSAGATVRAALAVAEAAVPLSKGLAGDAFGDRIDEVQRLWGHASGVVGALGERDYGVALAHATAVLSTVRGDVALPRDAVTLMGLAASLADARDNRDVRLAFEAAASPIGGWEAKRYGEGPALSLTAYPGGAVGYERALPADSTQRVETGWAAGVSLPIGIDWQWAAPNLWSIGVSFPILDLGALLNYRLSGSDAVDSAPNATVRQVFAPGAFLTVGLRKIPLTVYAGPQLMPGLRSGAEGAARDAWQIRAGVAVDIVLFEF